ncbi:gamma-glutamylcyclotransferase family protein [Haloarcula litorea]|uniref:gamma-glutamylcyclotransferase family protein n=1 Tax=Haloarcula litorea TaxID=3032579 RepID=UPI0023E8E240|nr:gamma-glutamylcyclotransferase family protein [Halomicroarcula sp. GDY20]
MTAPATVFVYGTLTDPGTADRLLPSVDYRGRATLVGLHRVDGDYPTLAPGGEVAGRLLRTTALDALDAYEGVDRGLYVRVSIPVADADGETVECYVGDPDALGAPADWPGDGPFADRVRAHCRDAGVVVEPRE